MSVIGADGEEIFEDPPASDSPEPAFPPKPGKKSKRFQFSFLVSDIFVVYVSARFGQGITPASYGVRNYPERQVKITKNNFWFSLLFFCFFLFFLGFVFFYGKVLKRKNRQKKKEFF